MAISKNNTGNATSAYADQINLLQSNANLTKDFINSLNNWKGDVKLVKIFSTAIECMNFDREALIKALKELDPNKIREISKDMLWYFDLLQKMHNADWSAHPDKNLISQMTNYIYNCEGKAPHFPLLMDERVMLQRFSATVLVRK